MFLMAISMLQTEFLLLTTPDGGSDCIDIADAILTGNTCRGRTQGIVIPLANAS
jgi:hypothetical protein